MNVDTHQVSLRGVFLHLQTNFTDLLLIEFEGLLVLHTLLSSINNSATVAARLSPSGCKCFPTAATYRVSQDGLGSGDAYPKDVLERSLNPLAVGDLNVANSQVLDDQSATGGWCSLQAKAG